MTKPELSELKELIKLREKPESTLALKRALMEPSKTVETYEFVESLKTDFENIFEAVASGRGAGFWIQAEWGGGKTHFLSTVTSLASNIEPGIWDKVNDPEIRNYSRRLENSKLFPVVFSLMGATSPENEGDNLLAVIETQIGETLEGLGIREDVKIGPPDEIISQFEHYNPSLKSLIKDFALNELHKSVEGLEKEELADVVRQYWSREGLKPDLSSASIKNNIAYIYRQLDKIGYSGLLVVIDEFASWQRKHQADPKAVTQDQVVLETLGWTLPREEGLKIYAFVASAEPPPAKLKDRFREFALLSGKDEEFAIIFSRRIRRLKEEKQPEIDLYYNYFKQQFRFLRGIDNQRFLDLFPFHPKCFEVIRRIAARGYTTRAAITYFYEILENPEIQSKNSLIRIDELLSSQTLMRDLEQRFGAASESYRSAIAGVESLEFEPNDPFDEKGRCINIVNALFLWHAAYPETRNTLSSDELAEMLLESNDPIKGSDLVRFALTKLSDLPQIRYTAAKGAEFVVVDKDEQKNSVKLGILKRAIGDESVLDLWLKSLIWKSADTLIKPGLYSTVDYEAPKIREVEVNKIKYPGEVVLRKDWNEKDGQIVKEDHFRVVILAQAQEIDETEIQDSRIAVLVPSEITTSLKNAIKTYLAVQEFEAKHLYESDANIEETREWLASEKKAAIRDILAKQPELYKNGHISTKQSLALDKKSIFSDDQVENILAKVVKPLLTNAYSDQLFNSADMLKTFSANEAKKVFEGFFKEGQSSQAKSACKNYGPALGLSKIDDPCQFDPDDRNRVFELFTDKLRANDEIEIWKLYEELKNPPIGLIKELTTVFLLCFVRAHPDFEIRLKLHSSLDPELKLRGKITSYNISQLEWSGPKLESSFDRLTKTSERTWDEVVPFGRNIVSDLKSVSTVEEIAEQESILLIASRQLVAGVREDIDALSTSQFFDDDLTEELLILKRAERIASAINFREFFEIVYELYPSKGIPDLEAFNRDFELIHGLHFVSQNSMKIHAMKEYLCGSTLPENDPLNQEKLRLERTFSLRSVIERPSLYEEIKASFEEFKTTYRSQYQIFHREFYKEIGQLLKQIQETKAIFGFLRRIEKLGIGMKVGLMEQRCLELRRQLNPCANEDLIHLADGMPRCETCGLVITSTPPKEQVAVFTAQIHNCLPSVGSTIVSLLTPLQRIDTSGRLKPFCASLDKKEWMNLPNILTDELVAYIQECNREASIKYVESDVLRLLAQKYKFVEEGDIEELVKDFEANLKEMFEHAKRDNPEKTIRIAIR